MQGGKQEGPSLLSSPASQSVRAPGSIKDVFHSVSWKIVEKDADVDLWPPHVCVHIQTRTLCTQNKCIFTNEIISKWFLLVWKSELCENCLCWGQAASSKDAGASLGPSRQFTSVSQPSLCWGKSHQFWFKLYLSHITCQCFSLITSDIIEKEPVGLSNCDISVCFQKSPSTIVICILIYIYKDLMHYYMLLFTCPLRYPVAQDSPELIVFPSLPPTYGCLPTLPFQALELQVLVT